MMLQLLLIPQKDRRIANLRQQHIEIAIPVDIGKRGAATRDGLEQSAGRIR
jgi:hypothetical protein